MKPSAALARYLVLFAGVVATRESAPTAVPDLSGTWRLNREQSDDPQKKWQESGGGSDEGDSDAPPPSGGYRGHMGGGHGGGHGGWRRGGGGREGGGTPSLEGRERLTIRHAEPQLSVVDADGRERILYTDGRKVEEEHSRGGTTKVRTVWKDGHIVVTSDPERGPKVVETYAMTADRSQLTITTTLEGRRKLTWKSVYDAVREPVAVPTPAPTPGETESDIFIARR